MINKHKGVVDCLCHYCRGQCGIIKVFNVLEMGHPNFQANVANIGGMCKRDQCAWGDVCVRPVQATPIPPGEHVCTGYVDYTTVTWVGVPSAPFKAGCGHSQWERHLVPVWNARTELLREELREHVERAGDQIKRRVVLYVPKSLAGSPPDSVLIVAPDTGNTPENMFDMASIHARAEALNILVIGLEGIDNNQLNVGLNVQPQWPQDEDVPYALAVLREMHELYDIDPLRVFCAGFSRGGRFCARLASELSPLIASIGVAGSLRYPEPNHAKRPVPVIAFHGSGDPINPLHGGGKWYWQSSVDDARSRWADFNGCQSKEVEGFRNGCAELTTSSNCTEGADVQLYVLPGAGHTWPGSLYKFHRTAGFVAHCVDATEQLLEFFDAHPLPQAYEEATLELLNKSFVFPTNV